MTNYTLSFLSCLQVNYSKASDKVFSNSREKQLVRSHKLCEHFLDLRGFWNMKYMRSLSKMRLHHMSFILSDSYHLPKFILLKLSHEFPLPFNIAKNFHHKVVCKKSTV